MTDLELQCMENPVRDGALLPAEAAIFINLHPAALADRRIVDGLCAATVRHCLAPERVVLEITEQPAIRDVVQTLDNVDATSTCSRFEGHVFTFHVLHER